MLNIGLDLGDISPTLFTMMVLMALATTIATTPILELLVPQRVSEGREGFSARIPGWMRAAARFSAD